MEISFGMSISTEEHFDGFAAHGPTDNGGGGTDAVWHVAMGGEGRTVRFSHGDEVVLLAFGRIMNVSII